MKKVLLVVAVMVMVMAFGATSYASVSQRPIDVVAKLTGLSVDEVQELRNFSRFSEIVTEAGVLEAFKTEMLDVRRAMVNHGLTNGRLTQEQADKIMDAFLSKIDNCDGQEVNLSQFELALARRVGQFADKIRGKR